METIERVREPEGSALSLGLGLFLTLLGGAAILYSALAAVFSVLLLGLVLVLGGVLLGFHALRRVEGRMTQLLLAILAIAAGYLVLLNPVGSALSLSLLIALYFVVAGLFRAISAIRERFDGWGWVLANGAVSLLLGALLLVGWPSSGLWALGLFVGIDLAFAGLGLMLMGSARRWTRRTTLRTAPVG